MSDSATSKSPKRRRFLRTALVTGAGGAVAMSGTVFAQDAKHKHGHMGADGGHHPLLSRSKWSARNWKIMNQLILENGMHSKGYDAKRRPYAVFDWDNTSIMNDCEEALLMYQINHLAFKLNPKEFSTIIRQNVPPGPFIADYKNAAGQIVDLESICADLDADYAFIHMQYAGMAGSRSLEEMQQTPQFLDFRVKLVYLYEAVNDTHGVKVGYPWVIYFFANMAVEQLSRLAEASHDAGLGASLTKTKYTSPAMLPGKAGVVSVTHFHGLRICSEISELMDIMRTHGIDVYVSTASLEDVVAVFANHPKYGFHVARENVLGLRLEQVGGLFKNAYLKDWPLNWGPGKTELIKRELQGKKGYGPLFVAGDSDGDYDMLRDFPDTQLGLIVNRLKKGKIGELCKAAVDSGAANKPRYVLQGRQESTGNWSPNELCLKYGKTVGSLLP